MLCGPTNVGQIANPADKVVSAHPGFYLCVSLGAAMREREREREREKRRRRIIQVVRKMEESGGGGGR